MTKVRGGKGFDALFSRFFDEPGLKSAVDSLHDNFSSTDTGLPDDEPAVPVAQKKQAAAPPVSKKQVVANAAVKKKVVTPVAASKTQTKLKADAPKKESEPEQLKQEETQELTPEQLVELEALSSTLTSGWSVELLDEQDGDTMVEPTAESPDEQSDDRLPVIDIYEPPLEDTGESIKADISGLEDDIPSHVTAPPAAEEYEELDAPVEIELPVQADSADSAYEQEIEPVYDSLEEESTDQLPVIDIVIPSIDDDPDPDDRQFEDFFSQKGRSSVAVEEPAPAIIAHETVVVPVVHSVTMHETPVTPAALAAIVRETAKEPVALAAAVREPAVAPVVPAVTVRQTVVEPVANQEPAPVATTGYTENDNDDDELIMEDFFSRKGKHPVAASPKVHAPAVAVRETVAESVVNEEPAAVAPAGFIDNDNDDDNDLLIEGFFSRKGKSPVAPSPKVHTPAVAPFKHERPATAAAVVHGATSAPQVTPTRVVTQTHGVKPETALPKKAEKPLYQPLVHPHFQSEDLSTVSRRRPLSKDQGRILVYLYEVAQGCSNVDTIRKELSIDSHTVRESLLVLVTEGYLYLLDKKRDSRFNPAGFSYKMNNYLCSRYASRARRGSWDQSQDQPTDASVWRAKGPSSTTQPVTLSSIMSRAIVAPAVQKESPAPAVVTEKESPAAKPALSAAVGAYWEKEGLEDSLALKWCSTFGVEPKQMYQQLEWARFDLETNKRRETIKKDLVSWFYDRLMITGGTYLRPANYRTAEEIKADTMQNLNESDLTAQAKIVEIEFENALRTFLADPEAPLYRELLKRVNAFALEHLKTDEGNAEDVGLDALFKLHWGATSNDPATSGVSFALSELGAGQSDKTISLVVGWNLVGYDAVHSQPVHHAISSIASLIESVWGWSYGHWLSYVPGRQENSLTNLEPGMGYWIKMKQPATWTVS